MFIGSLAGYLNNQEASDQMVDSEGWLHTGDVGYYDKDEHFFIVDGLKNLIKFRGHQVSLPHQNEKQTIFIAGVKTINGVQVVYPIVVT